MTNPAAQILEQGIAFVRRAGLRVDAIDRGHVRCTMPLSGNENHVGMMYAGALYTLAELPGGALYLTSFDTARYFPIVVEQTIRYTAPARSDISVEVSMTEQEITEIQARADADGKAVYVLEAELKDDQGIIVATSRATYQLRAHKS